MTPDFEKGMKEKMERASLKDIMSDFDTEQEWQQLAGKVQHEKKTISFKVWRYAAALVILLVATWFIMFLIRSDDRHHVKQTVSFDSAKSAYPVLTNGDNDTAPSELPVYTPAIAKKNPGHNDNTGHQITSIYRISNSTDCPMEISICQTMKCPNSKPAAISSSSTLEPGQSGTLNYKANDSVPKNCSVTVDQIEIKSTVTGEAIMLNAYSSPATAQEVFRYISGEKRGDVLAGRFDIDCNHRKSRHNLRLDNRAGNVIMQ